MSVLRGVRLVQDAKVSRYLLNREHPEGGGKAKFFIGSGFDQAYSYLLRQALLDHPEANKVIATELTDFGVKSVVRCSLATPDGRNPCIASVWICEASSDVQRLVTAYPIG